MFILIVLVLVSVIACSGPDNSKKAAGDEPQTSAHADLRVNDTARVSFGPLTGGRTGELDVTVTAVDKGEPRQLRRLQHSAKYKGMTPWYVHYSLTNRGPDDATGTSVPTDLTAYDSKDKPAQEILVIGGFGSCGPEQVERAFPPGDKRRGCDIALTATGRSLKELRYQPLTGAFAADPIVWSIARGQ